MPRPLEGIKVLDFTHGVAGPYCSMVLADLGCEVVKIEMPNRGDPTRYMNVSEKFDTDIPNTGGDYFLAINRNKKSVGIDMKTSHGRRACHDLAKWADLAVQNFRPGVMARLGLDYAALGKVNARLIYASISAYGEGAMAEKPGMDIAVQARSGVMRLTGAPDSDEPIRPGVSLADFGGGIYLATAILAAMFERERSGKGQEVSVSLLDATMAMLSNYSVAVMSGHADLKPLGSGHPQLVPYQAFPTADSHVVVSAGTNKIYRAFCNAIERQDLGMADSFRTNQDRVRNRNDLVAQISSELRSKTTEEWIAIFEAAGVPCAPVNDMTSAYRDLKLNSPDMVVQVDHPSAGPISMVGSPFVFSRTNERSFKPPPILGEHTDEVMTEVGWTKDEIGDLATDEG